MERRLEELANLKDRWLDGKGIAPDRARLKALLQNFDRYFDAALPLPYLYPTPEGGVLAEWSLGQWSVSLDIEIASQTARYEAVHLTADESSEFTLDLNELAGWNALHRELRQLSGLAGTE